MAELYRRGKTWYAWGYDRHGQRWRRSTKQRDRTAAKAVAAKIEQELALDADQPRDEACTLEVACEVMLEHAERIGRSEKTVEFLTTKSRHLLRLLGASKRCSRLVPADTTNYMHTRLDEGASKLTVQYEIRVLVQALRRAAKLGLYRPTVDPSHLKPDELIGAYVPRERWLTQGEYRLLLAELDPARTKHSRSQDRRDYVAVWCQTGMRDSELYRVRLEHLDFERRILYVPGTKTAKSRGRPVPMTPNVEEILRRRLDAIPEGQRSTTDLFPRWTTVQRDLYVACLRIEARLNEDWKQPTPDLRTLSEEEAQRLEKRRARGLPTPKRERVRPPNPCDPVTPNDLRRTFASWLAQAGVPLHHTAKLMGHGSTKMLERVYARLAPETLRAAIAFLPEGVTAAVESEKTVTDVVTASSRIGRLQHAPAGKVSA